MKYDKVEKLGHLSGKYKLSNDEMSKYKTSLTQVIINIIKTVIIMMKVKIMLIMMNWITTIMMMLIVVIITALPPHEDGVKHHSKQPKFQVEIFYGCFS